MLNQLPRIDALAVSTSSAIIFAGDQNTEPLMPGNEATKHKDLGMRLFHKTSLIGSYSGRSVAGLAQNTQPLICKEP